MNKFLKTDGEIKEQMLHWFYKYHRQSIDKFSGQEQFTLFDKLLPNEQKYLSQILAQEEIPVLILKTNSDDLIICTTRRFIHKENSKITELKYADFDRHVGYKSIAIIGQSGRTINIKTDGHFAEFGLQNKSGEIIYWKIPTGHSGFAFWNITKKFDIIGRKYLSDDKNDN